jgi:dihydroorotase
MLCIKNGNVVDGINKSPFVADILIMEDKVVEIGTNISSNSASCIDATGKWVIPGLVDAHCHLREPGFEHKEDILSGMKSAAAGGFTSIACMANTNPVIDNAPLVEYIINKALSYGLIRVFPIASVTKGQMGQELTDMAELKEAGAVALSDDGKPILNSAIMKTALEYAGGLDLLIISHCEDLALAAGGAMNEGEMSTRLGLKGISKAAEEIMVARDILISETTGVRVHLAHISTRGSVELIRQAKARGVKVTCETAPHYFSADERMVDGYDTNAKVNPPLRTFSDVCAVIDGLTDGTIDIIATDHAPHHKDDKNVEFALAANGLSGFELAFSLACTNLVKTNHIDMARLVELMCTKPAKILGIKAGTIEINGRADVAVVDTEREYVVDADRFYSKGKNTPFHGSLLNGLVLHTISGGKLIFHNGKIV